MLVRKTHEAGVMFSGESNEGAKIPSARRHNSGRVLRVLVALDEAEARFEDIDQLTEAIIQLHTELTEVEGQVHDLLNDPHAQPSLLARPVDRAAAAQLVGRLRNERDCVYYLQALQREGKTYPTLASLASAVDTLVVDRADILSFLLEPSQRDLLPEQPTQEQVDWLCDEVRAGPAMIPLLLELVQNGNQICFHNM
jgi:hypothetical protein